MTPKSAVTAFNMATILRPSVNDLTAQLATQSKEFREELNFESLMMILCNRLRHLGAFRTDENAPANEDAGPAASAPERAAAATVTPELCARQKADQVRQSCGPKGASR
jgi:hypothetical protein